MVREWEVIAEDREIEVAPGVRFQAWTFNGRIPGPTLRCTEGDLRACGSSTARAPAHHAFPRHPYRRDGRRADGRRGIISPARSSPTPSRPNPRTHLYHCHVGPLAEHIARGMYGTFIVDPKAGRPPADELVLVQHGYNTTFDGQGNQLYAVNGIPFVYMNDPIRVRRGKLVRIYLVNILEYDPINSFHLHGNFFDYYPTGTRLEPTEFTDTVIQGQGSEASASCGSPTRDSSCSTPTRRSSPISDGWGSSMSSGTRCRDRRRPNIHHRPHPGVVAGTGRARCHRGGTRGLRRPRWRLAPGSLWTADRGAIDRANDTGSWLHRDHRPQHWA